MNDDILKMARYLVEFEGYTYTDLESLTQHEIVDIYESKFEEDQK